MNKKIKEIEGDIFECPPIYKDFWSPKVLDYLNEKIDDWHNGKLYAPRHFEMRPDHAPNTWFSQGGVFTYNLIKNRKGHIIHEEFFNDIKSELDNIYDFSNLKYVSCDLRFMTLGGGLPWHEDANYSFVTTTYLNQKPWNKDWGGALLYQNKHGEIGAQFPEYNKMVVQSGGFNCENNMEHSTTPVQQDAFGETSTRISMQMFCGDFIPQGVESADGAGVYIVG